MNSDIDLLISDEKFERVLLDRIKLNEGFELTEKYFISTTFNNCDFSKCILKKNVFRNCKFIHCNLSLSDLTNSVLDNIEFSDCQLMGINWSTIKWPKEFSKRKIKFPVSFNKCILNFSTFFGIGMYQASFKDCVIKEASFESVDLECSHFHSTDLTDTIFGNCNLSKADFSMAKNYSINPCTNKIKRAKFSFPEALSLIYSLDIEITE